MRYFIFLITLFISCKSNKNNDNKTITQQIVCPKVLQTDYFDTTKIIKEDISWLSTGNYYIYYIGKEIDTILLGSKIYFSSIPPKIHRKKGKTIETDTIANVKSQSLLDKYCIDWDKENPYKQNSHAALDIQVCSNNLASKSIPVIIKNTSKDTITIGYGNRVLMFMEALDSQKNWKPIEEEFLFACGNGIGSIILPPNEIVLSLAPYFRGNYKTQLRLNLHGKKSNTFLGYINYRQFKTIYNESGNYCDEFLNENPEYKK